MAKRFRFRLDTLERIRRRQRDEHRRRVGDAAAGAERARRKLDRLAGDVAALVEQSRKDRVAGPVAIGALRQGALHRLVLDRLIETARTELAARERELGVRRAALVEASRHLKVIEKLRERRWARHRDMEEKRERSEQDEAANLAHSFGSIDEIEVSS